MGFIEHHGVVKFLIQDLSDSDVEPVTFIYNTKTRQHEELPVVCHYEAFINVTYISDSLQFHDGETFSGSCSLDPVIQSQIKIYGCRGDNTSISPDGSRLIKYEFDEDVLKVTLKGKSATRSGDQQDYDIIWQTKVHFVEESVEDEAFPVEQKKRKKKKSINIVRKPKQRIPVDPFMQMLRRTSIDFFWLTNDIIITAHNSKMVV